MKSHTASYSFKPFSIANTNFTDAEFHFEKQNTSQILDLYRKHEDEPDFDCEFLKGITHEQTENSIDLDSEQEQMDDYNDYEWDPEIYDPYLESTYY
ncbi:hypothetical protein J0383_04820 [Flavobacterium endoglycinae]|uniref:Uncharacterized protein n=1 Tax=Flavobacterium endoglycinae TaxID=2816357 RepID=A0ABX7QGR7_9FLAO|nr:hypothetical protein [Flavobacterium endoglycinae]QSW90142.1 hypothetical protein J0383_04820 [Flavobacterium endoglycinae]